MDTEIRRPLESFKQAITIIFGLTLTNAIMVLLTRGTYSKIYAIYDLSFCDIFICLILIVNCLRFYHGNMKSVAIEYKLYLNKESSGRWLFTDISVFFIQIMILSVMSFYIYNFNLYLTIYLILLAVDVVWGASKYIFLKLKQAKGEKVHKEPHVYFRWSLINVIFGVAIFFAWTDGIYGNILYFLLVVNTFLDFCINWKYYIPIQTVAVE